MSDFRHMFPETDEEVIEAVLRANNGMVDATIDQLLTMNIDSDVVGDDDDLSDHILMSVERDVQQQQSQFSHPGSRRSGRESKSNKVSFKLYIIYININLVFHDIYFIKSNIELLMIIFHC